MLKPNAAKFPSSLCVLAGVSATAGLAMFWWLAANMPGGETLTIGAVLLAAFGYHTCHAVCTLSNELRELEAPLDV